MDPTINILSMPWLFTYSTLVLWQVITNNPIIPSTAKREFLLTISIQSQVDK